MTVDFQAWLANPDNNNRRNLLVDAKVYTGGSETTRKMSYLDAPKAGPYHPVIAGIPVFEQRLTSPFSGRTEISVGTLDIINHDGSLDDWLFESWGGRDIELRFGDVSWDYADYEVIHTGTVKFIEAPDTSSLRLVFTDSLARLDKQIQLNTVDDGKTGDIEIPLCYGPVYQITPKLVSGADYIYQIHDGPVVDVEAVGNVFINGDHNVASYTDDSANGKIDMSAKPDGVLTLESIGDSGVGVNAYPGEIIRAIVTDKGDLSDPGDLDAAAFTAMDTDAYVLGVYIDSPENILSVLDEIVGSVGGWYGMTREGKLTVGYIRAPDPSDSVATFRASEGKIVSRIRVTPMTGIKPRYQTRITHTRAWTKNTSTNPNINENHREWFRIGHKVAEYVDPDESDIKDEYADAEAPEAEQTLISGRPESAAEADALAEAQRRQELFNVQRYFCEFTASVAAFTLNIGDVITVYDDTEAVPGRYGFATGREIVVTGLEEHLGRGFINITGWF